MKAVKAIAFILVGLIAAASLTLIIINMVRQDDQTQTVNSFIDRQDERYAESQKKEDEFIEDGAVIGTSTPSRARPPSPMLTKTDRIRQSFPKRTRKHTTSP